MKRTAALTGLILALCALAGAQENTGDRVVVPARNTTHPRVVKVSSVFGSITVKTYNGKEVIVESKSSSDRSKAPQTFEGLKRLDLPRGLEVTEEDNVINVRPSPLNRGGLVITVPPDTSLQLNTTHDGITVDGVHGDIAANTTHADITLKNVSGTVSANSTHGDVKVTMDRVDPGKPLSFSSVHGDIDVALPDDVKLNVKMSTLQGSIYSDFEIQLNDRQITQASGSSEAKFVVRTDRTITGTINGGGTEASFRTLHGKILLRKRSGAK
jgi:hypothetical protein